MWRAAACAHRKGPSRSVARTRRQSSYDVSRADRLRPTPPQLTITSKPPSGDELPRSALPLPATRGPGAPGTRAGRRRFDLRHGVARALLVGMERDAHVVTLHRKQLCCRAADAGVGAGHDRPTSSLLSHRLGLLSTKSPRGTRPWWTHASAGLRSRGDHSSLRRGLGAGLLRSGAPGRRCTTALTGRRGSRPRAAGSVVAPPAWLEAHRVPAVHGCRHRLDGGWCRASLHGGHPDHAARRAARAARRHRRRRRGATTASAASCTVLLDGRRHLTCLALAVAHDGAEVVDRRRPAATATGCTRCSRRSSTTTATSAATARPARSARRSACSTRPSRATRATSPRTSRPRSELTDDEIRERMSGNLCRCGAYAGILAAVARGGGPA